MAEAIRDAREAALAALFDDGSADIDAHLLHKDGPHGWVVDRLVVDIGRPGTAIVDGAEGRRAAPVRAVVTAPPVEEWDDVLADLAELHDTPGSPLAAVEVPLAARDAVAEVEAVRAATRALRSDVVVVLAIPLATRAAGEVVRRLHAAAGLATGGAPDAIGRRVAVTADLGDGGAGAATDVELAGLLRACAAARLALAGVEGRWRPTEEGADPPGDPTLRLLAAAAVAHRGGRLEAIVRALRQPADALRLGSGALIAGGEVIESELLASTRRHLLHSLVRPDLAEQFQQLLDLGVLTSPIDPR